MCLLRYFVSQKFRLQLTPIEFDFSDSRLSL